jgi:hypothetical protein
MKLISDNSAVKRLNESNPIHNGYSEKWGEINL